MALVAAGIFVRMASCIHCQSRTHLCSLAGQVQLGAWASPLSTGLVGTAVCSEDLHGRQNDNTGSVWPFKKNVFL